MKKGTEVPELQKLIVLLEKTGKKNKARIWIRVAELLKAPRRKRVEINLGKLNKLLKEGETAVVPGKVLSVGSLDKNVLVAAVLWSTKAFEKAGGKLVSINELIEKNPSGKGVKIIV